VFRDHRILGFGGDLDNIGAYMRSYDPETGKVMAWTTLQRTRMRNRRPIWMTGTYDPDLNMLYTGRQSDAGV